MFNFAKLKIELILVTTFGIGLAAGIGLDMALSKNNSNPFHHVDLNYNISPDKQAIYSPSEVCIVNVTEEQHDFFQNLMWCGRQYAIEEFAINAEDIK